MINNVILMGRLTADPELRQTTSGISSCIFTVAVNRSFKNSKGEYEADFINCIAWRQTAEFISRYFSKGKMIIVEGSLRNNNYTDQNGVKHYSMNVQADNIAFGESKNASTEVTADNVGNVQQHSQLPLTPQPVDASNQLGDLSDFEEILSDGEVPF